MSEQRHRIRRQVLEVAIADRQQAWALQAQLSRIQAQQLEALIDRCLSDLVGPNQICRIDSLELDLGTLDLENLERDLVVKLEKTLRAAVRKRLREDSEMDRLIGEDPEAQSRLELVAFFLQNGSLPWWADGAAPKLLNQSLSILLRRMPRSVAALIRGSARERGKLMRIVLHCDDERLSTLFLVLVDPVQSGAPVRSAQGIAIVKSLLKARSQLTLSSASSWRTNLWMGLLRTASLEMYSSAEPTRFWQTGLAEVAIEAGQTYGALIDALNVIASAEREHAEPDPLHVIVRELHAQIPRRLPRLNAESERSEKRIDSQRISEVWQALEGILAESDVERAPTSSPEREASKVPSEGAAALLKKRLVEENDEAPARARIEDSKQSSLASASETETTSEAREASASKSEATSDSALASRSESETNRTSALVSAAVLTDGTSSSSHIEEELAETLSLAANTSVQLETLTSVQKPSLQKPSDPIDEMNAEVDASILQTRAKSRPSVTPSASIDPSNESGSHPDTIHVLNVSSHEIFTQRIIPKSTPEPEIELSFDQASQSKSSIAFEVIRELGHVLDQLIHLSDLLAPLFIELQIQTRHADGKRQIALLESLRVLLQHFTSENVATLALELEPIAQRELRKIAQQGFLTPTVLQRCLQVLRRDTEARATSADQPLLRQQARRKALLEQRLTAIVTKLPIDLSHSDADAVYVDNAGLILLWPFLTNLFERLELTEDNQFVSRQAMHRAVGLLQHLTTGEAEPQEYQVVLFKVMCGMELTEIFQFGDSVTSAESEECTQLLTAALLHGQVFGELPIEAFRQSFLMRKGSLSARDGLWLLRVERAAEDAALLRLPWSTSWVKLPWLASPLQVEW